MSNKSTNEVKNTDARSYEFICIKCRNRTLALGDWEDHNESCESVGYTKNHLVNVKKSLSLSPDKSKMNSSSKPAEPNEKELVQSEDSKKNASTIGKAIKQK